MAPMIRKQVYIEPRHEATLKRLARIGGVTEAEIVRRAIDQTSSTVLGGTGQPDREAWEEARSLIVSLIAQGPVAGGRSWTREDAHEERLSRYGPTSDTGH